MLGAQLERSVADAAVTTEGGEKAVSNEQERAWSARLGKTNAVSVVCHLPDVGLCPVRPDAVKRRSKNGKHVLCAVDRFKPDGGHIRTTAFYAFVDYAQYL